MLLSWTELAQKEYPKDQFLLDPYIVRGGITLMWGKTSIGKSPVTWEMARCIGQGLSFFGLPTTPGRVLYLELDTPERVIQQRLKTMKPSPNVWWLFLPPMSVPFVADDIMDQLKEARDEVQPDLVFINTLRKCHNLDDIKSNTPSLIWGFFTKQFPKSALFFVHHMRKSSQDPKAIEHEKEGFSGSQVWLNDVQCGLHLEEYDGGDEETLRLYHRKSQVSRTLKPLPLKLEQDGATLTSSLYNELLWVYEKVNSDDEFRALPAGDQDTVVAKHLGVSTATAKRRRLSILGGDFPGSHRWLLGD